MTKQERAKKVLESGQINIEQKAILTKDEVMVLYDLSPNTLEEWQKEGLLPMPLIRGGKTYYDHEKVKAKLLGKRT